MPHCIEGGYALVEDVDRLVALDSHATPLIRDLIVSTDRAEGIRVRVTREREDGAMQTRNVQLAPQHS